MGAAQVDAWLPHNAVSVDDFVVIRRRLAFGTKTFRSLSLEVVTSVVIAFGALIVDIVWGKHLQSTLERGVGGRCTRPTSDGDS
jgi:hypothetical protein